MSTAGIYILVPFALSGLYTNSYNHTYWTLGLNESTQKAFDFIKKNEISGNIFNNIEAKIEADLFFKNSTTFFNRNTEKQTQLFNTLIYNSDQWNQYYIDKNINVIFFSLVNQSQDVLLFLGSQLNTGNWAIIYEEKDSKVILMKKTPENQQIINRFEPFSNPRN